VKFLPEGWRHAFRLWRRAPEQEVDAELGFHFDERIADLMAGGMSPESARTQAVAEFGDLVTVRAGLVAIDEQIVGRRRGVERWEWVAQDIGYVLRSLRRSSGFVVTVTLTLALGLGANAAIFSLLDRLFLQSPPGIAHPDQVRRIYRYYRPDTASYANARALGDFTVFAYSDLRDIAAIAPAEMVIAGYTKARAQVGTPGDGAEVGSTLVLGDYFAALGVRPAVGRFFSPDEARLESDLPVAVISHRLWQARFSGRPDIAGQPVDVDGHRYLIIGVTAGRFHGADNDANDIWLPMSAMRWSEGAGLNWRAHDATGSIKLLAVVSSAASAGALTRAATLVFRRSSIKADDNPVAQLRPLIEAAGPDTDPSQVAMATRLAGVSLIILLIACANVANLLLARGARRTREIAVRLALGVSRRRLIALLLGESLVIAIIGGSVALAVALPGAVALRRMLLPETDWADPAMNPHVLIFTLLLALVTGLAAGLVPALQASRTDLAAALKSGVREGTFQRSRVRTALLVTQASLSVLLLTGAGVFVRSLHRMESADIGYAAERLVFASVRAAGAHPERQRAIWARLADLSAQLGRLPGVESTALTSNTPMQSSWAMSVFLPGRDSLMVGVSFVSPSYAATLGIRLLQGRGLDADDGSGPASAVLVNATMARALWPGQAAVGQCLIERARSNGCSTVVGVVSDAHDMAIDELPGMRFYRPLEDDPKWGAARAIAVLAAPGRTALVADEVRRSLRDEFSGWATPSVHIMTDYTVRELRPRRVGAALFSVAGFLALVVAIVGIYGTISYTFGQRTHEIGVRIALGARAGHVVRLVVGEGVRVVLVGVAIGLALSLAAGKLVATLLYHTSPRDPVVLVVVAVSLLLAATGACLVPAWRALRVDPATALRAE
jgi:putative ABC transport system permease protein